MKTLKVLSALLCYPQADMQAALDEMIEVLDQENVLPQREHRALLTLIDQIRRTDLIELQERYVRLFDRGRALSLHLFEHIHGQSRDRGQAMVNLLDVYRRHGFELDARELPDYIPLFLEYLAQRPMKRRWICWPMPCTSWRCSAPGWLNRAAITTSCSTRWPPWSVNRRTSRRFASRPRPRVPMKQSSIWTRFGKKRP
jgi:nitrate reductase molybdenum cofactor assembly chaperone